MPSIYDSKQNGPLVNIDVLLENSLVHSTTIFSETTHPQPPQKAHISVGETSI